MVKIRYEAVGIPTLSEALARIGRDGVVAVVAMDAGGEVNTFDDSDRYEFRDRIEIIEADNTVLGYIISEE